MLEKQGAQVFIGHNADNLGDTDLLVYSAAVSMENAELAEARRRGIPIITRADQLSSVKMAHEGENPAGYAYYSLAIGKPDRHMDPFRIEFTANAPTSPSSHEGEELIIVLAGSVELTYGPETTVLHAGDTAYYNSVVTHSLRALDGKPASIYGIVFLPF